MKLQKLENHYLSSELVDQFDLIVVYSCLESRSANVLNKLKGNAGKIFVIADQSNSSSHLTDIECESLHIFDVSGCLEAMRDVLLSLEGAYKIAVDISCLPQAVMADVLHVISMSECGFQIEVVVLYSLAEFTLPSSLVYANESIEPVHQYFAGWSSPETKPTSLVLGLGYEPNKAEGASEYFEPSDQWVFIPSSPIPEFLNEVHNNNSNLIKKTPQDRTIEYNVADPEVTYGQIALVISSLAKKSNPVLLPFGPKIFFFLCLVQCLAHPEVGVWRVTGVGDKGTQDISASEHVIGVRCVFS
ncbi:hypothetical protein [Pseudomonas sp. IT-P291]|uniref:hypothetical protein n=1 Tax=Pseudomonas sp. IT-P291 TaxID=3026448 RepID=UPI0039E1ED4A